MSNIIKISPTNSKNNISNFTNDQRKAYDELIKFIDEPFDEKDYKRS